MRQISKNRFLGIIRDEDYYRDYYMVKSRPRNKEIIFCSFGRFLILDKYLDAETNCHALKLKKLTIDSKPKTKNVEYIPLTLGCSEPFRHTYIHSVV